MRRAWILLLAILAQCSVLIPLSDAQFPGVYCPGRWVASGSGQMCLCPDGTPYNMGGTCGSASVPPPQVQYCPNGGTCKLDQTCCGSWCCGAGATCSRSGTCLPQGAVDCGGGQHCNAGTVCWTSPSNHSGYKQGQLYCLPPADRARLQEQLDQIKIDMRRRAKEAALAAQKAAQEKRAAKEATKPAEQKPAPSAGLPEPRPLTIDPRIGKDVKRLEPPQQRDAVPAPAGVPGQPRSPHTFLCGTPPNQYACPSTIRGTDKDTAKQPAPPDNTKDNPFFKQPTAQDLEKDRKAREQEWRELEKRRPTIASPTPSTDRYIQKCELWHGQGSCACTFGTAGIGRLQRWCSDAWGPINKCEEKWFCGPQ